MRILYAFLVMMICAGNVFGQKEYNQWINGFGSGIDFNYSPPIPVTFPTGNNWIFTTVASLCDSNGKLLIFTNGFRIFNRNFEIMQNGDSLNIGDYIAFNYGSLGIPDGAIIIPFPGNKKKYYVIHTNTDFINVPPFGELLNSTQLYYDVIDMTLDSGNGGVVPGQKEVLFLDDTLINNGIEAVRHGNGRDWWVICHEYQSNRYYRFLIDTNGIHGPYSQYIGMTYSGINGGGGGIFGYMKFNEQGTQFIKNNSDSTAFELYDFDRCNGLISNRKKIKVSDTLYQSLGISFSPSGRYVYVSANEFNYLFQFDLQSPNIEQSKVLIDKYNDFSDPFPVNFCIHDIGPDRKTYICSFDGNYALNVINSPDSAGKKCNFVQDQFMIPPTLYYNGWAGGMPNMPNLKLGPLTGSGCDTVTTNLPPITKSAFTHGIFPNPCTGKFQLSITGVDDKADVVIYNTMGQVIEQTTLQPINGFIHSFFNLQNEPAGVYLLKAETNRGTVEEKILKQ